MKRLLLLTLCAVVSAGAAGCAQNRCGTTYCPPATGGCCEPSYGAPMMVPGTATPGPVYMQPQTVVPGPA
jgi:hypothetical protein